MGAIERDVRIRMILEDESLNKGLANIGETIQTKTEPALKLIKANMITLNNRFEKAAGRTKTLGASVKQGTSFFENFAMAVFNFGRNLGFTGFVLNVTFSRINQSIMNIVTGLAKFSIGTAKVGDSISFLESTMVDLAMAGLLTKNTQNDVIKNFWDFFNASVALQGQIATLTNNLQPFRNILISVAAEGLTIINKRIQELKEKGQWDAIIEGWTAGARRVMTGITNAILYILENPAQFATSLELIGAALGGFAEGFIKVNWDSLIAVLKVLSGFFDDPEKVEAMSRNLGTLFGQLQLTGTGLTILGAPIQVIGLALQGLNTILSTSVNKAFADFIVTLSNFGKSLQFQKAILIQFQGSLIPLAAVFILITLVVATLILHWDSISKTINDYFMPAIDRLSKSMGGLFDVVKPGIDVMGLFKDALYPTSVIIEGIIVSVASLIDIFSGLLNLSKVWNKFMSDPVYYATHFGEMKKEVDAVIDSMNNAKKTFGGWKDKTWANGNMLSNDPIFKSGGTTPLIQKLPTPKLDPPTIETPYPNNGMLAGLRDQYVTINTTINGITVTGNYDIKALAGDWSIEVAKQAGKLGFITR